MNRAGPQDLALSLFLGDCPRLGRQTVDGNNPWTLPPWLWTGRTNRPSGPMISVKIRWLSSRSSPLSSRVTGLDGCSTPALAKIASVQCDVGI